METRKIHTEKSMETLNLKKKRVLKLFFASNICKYPKKAIPLQRFIKMDLWNLLLKSKIYCFIII